VGIHDLDKDLHPGISTNLHPPDEILRFRLPLLQGNGPYSLIPSLACQEIIGRDDTGEGNRAKEGQDEGKISGMAGSPIYGHPCPLFNPIEGCRAHAGDKDKVVFPFPYEPFQLGRGEKGSNLACYGNNSVHPLRCLSDHPGGCRSGWEEDAHKFP